MFTLTDTLNAVHRVLAAHPNGSNEGLCVYEVHGEPHCLVGQVLADLNVLDVVTDYESDPDEEGCTNTFGADSVHNEYDAFEAAGFTHEAIVALDAMQMYADGCDAYSEGHTPWEEAVALAQTENFESAMLAAS